MPEIGTGTIRDPFRPKYISTVGLTTWGMVPFYDASLTQKNACIIVAVVTPAQDTQLRAFSDVVATPLPQQASTPAKAAETRVLAVARATPLFADAT
jgi:hypothetical protein